MRNPARPRSGFSLAELLVALALFATAFATLLGVFTSSSSVVWTAEERLCAQALAQQVLENQRGRATATNITNQLHEATVWHRGTALTARYSYDVAINATLTGNLYDIAVAVYWPASWPQTGVPAGVVPRRLVMETAYSP